MKKARFWALLLTGILVFSTLSNDYIVASAAEVESEEPAPELIEGEAEGYMLSMVDDGAESEGTESESEEPAEETYEEQAEEYVEEYVEPVEEPQGETPAEEQQETPAEEVQEGQEELVDGTLTEEELTEDELEIELEDADKKDLEDEKLSEEKKEGEDEFPAIDFGTVSACGMSVTISAPKGAFPEGTEVSVKPVASSGYRDDIESQLAEDETIVKIVAVDITFTCDGGEVQPKEPISVKFGSISDSGDASYVFHDDEGFLDMVHSADGTGDASVSASSFSPWVFVVTEQGADVERPEDEAEDTSLGSVIRDGDGYTVKYTVGPNVCSVTGGSVHRYPETGDPVISKKYEIAVGSYVVEVSPAFTSRMSEYSGYTVEWDTYEWTSKNEVHINGSLVGPVTIQYVDGNNGDKVIEEETIADVRFNYGNGDKYTATAKEIEGYALTGNSSVTISPNKDASRNIIKFKYSRNEELTYTVLWIDKDTGTVFKSEVRNGGRRVGATVSVSEDERKGSGTPAGYVYLDADPWLTNLTLSETPEENIIKMFYKKTTGYSVHYYYQNGSGDYVENESEGSTVENYKSGESISVKASDKKTVDGVVYTLNKTRSKLTIDEAGLDAADNKLEVYYDRNDVKYRVITYYEKKSRDGFSSKSEDFSDGKQGVDLTYDFPDTIEVNGISYKLVESEDSVNSIPAAEVKVSNDAGDNKLKAYYERTQNEVWFSILYPGEGKVDYRAQAANRFYPTKIYGQGHWKGTANYLPDDTWYVYDWDNGINWGDYNIQMSGTAQAELNAYLAETYPGQNVHIVWYNYKNDEQKWGGAWYVNGYVVSDGEEEMVLASYDANYAGGATYADNEFKKGIKYKILGQDGDGAYGLTTREKYNFLGWSEDKNAKEATYQPGETVDMDKAYVFYAVWKELPADEPVEEEPTETEPTEPTEPVKPTEPVVEDPSGTLIITANTNSKTYDGKALSDAGYRVEGTNVDDLVVTAAVTGTITDAGTTANKVGAVTVKAGGKDVTKNFTITKVDGSLTVLPIELVVTTGSSQKIYDGTPLTNSSTNIEYRTGAPVSGETITVTATGSRTEIGGATNGASINWGAARESNYTVIRELGMLTVNKPGVAIVVSVIGGTHVYDGTAHGATVAVSGAASASGEVANLGAAGLPAGYAVAAAESDTTRTDVGKTRAVVSKLSIIDTATGADVTKSLSITYDYSQADIVVAPAVITIETESASKTYNGQPLTAGVSVSGLAAKDQALVTVAATGSQTAVGSSSNTYSIEWGSALSDNYIVVEKLGTLTVKAAAAPGSEDTTGGEPTTGGESTPDAGEPAAVTPAGDTPTTTAIATVTMSPDMTTPPSILDATPITNDTTDIPDEAVPLANPADVLGASRGIEADASSVLGARVAAANAGVLGARRDAQTSDSSNMAMYLILMGIATGVGGAYVSSRKRHEHEA